MKVLIISSVGDAGELDLCLKAQGSGHEVVWAFTPTERTKYIGKDMVKRVDDWRGWMRWADLVILGDNTKYLRELDGWRQREDIRIIGATTEAAAWELDRNLGQRVFERAGIETVPYKEFKSYDEAIRYVEKNGVRYACKPCGDEPDKSLSYCAKSPEDMIYMLQKWKKAKRHKGSFILQDFIPGIEMAVGGFFGPGGFNEGWWENWEEKQLMAGGTGPATGEQGTTIRVVKKSKLADKVLCPLEDQLEAVGYCGYVDVNCIIDDKGNPWPLEFTMRFGWPTINIQQELFEGDIIEWLAGLGQGRDVRRLKLNGLALGVTVAIPDYPYKTIPIDKAVGVPVYGITPSLHPHIHPCMMMWGDAPQETNGKIIQAPMPLTAGDYVLIATGSGRTVREAQSRAYNVTKKLKIPSSPFWRPDIGSRLKKQLPELQRMGYATGMAY